MKFVGLFLFCFLATTAVFAEWKVDFTHRQENIVKREKQRNIASEDKKSFLDMVFERQAPQQEIVIMHSEKGFSPNILQVKKDQRYKVHVVNVDEKTKNVSFMLDAFSQHHGTFFGKPVSFIIEPRKEGMYQFLCPETAAKGRLVVTGLKNPVVDPLQGVELRQPASEE